MKDRIIISLFITAIVAVVITFGYFITGEIISKPDVIVKQTSDLLYVKQYSIYNRDSTIRVFNAPKIYDGIVSYKHRHSRYVGVPGKGGHHQTSYHVGFSYNGKHYQSSGSRLYNQLEKGDHVKIKESWYPYHNIEIITNK